MSKKTEVIINVALIGALLLVLFLLENALPSTHMLFTVLKKGAIYALVAVSMNLLNGFTGLFSLGQAGFMLVGAYTYGVLTIPVAERANVYMYFDGGIIQFALHPIVAIILAGVIAGIFAFLIGLPVLRLKSDYLAIATLGFAEIIRAIFQWDKLGPLTNGSNLLRSYPSYKSVLFYFVAAGICIALIVMMINSTYGRAFKAIRDDEVAAEAMGIGLAHHKQIAFVVSSFFAGISGALLAMYQTSVQAAMFKSAFLDSDTYIGNFHVPLLRSGFRKVVFAVIIMVIVLFFRQGIMGTKEFSVRGIYNKLTGKSRGDGKGGSTHE